MNGVFLQIAPGAGPVRPLPALGAPFATGAETAPGPIPTAPVAHGYKMDQVPSSKHGACAEAVVEGRPGELHAARRSGTRAGVGLAALRSLTDCPAGCTCRGEIARVPGGEARALPVPGFRIVWPTEVP